MVNYLDWTDQLQSTEPTTALSICSLIELDRVVLRISYLRDSAVRVHVTDFTEYLGTCSPRSFECRLQIFNLENDNCFPCLLGHRLSRTCDAESGLVARELNPLASIGEADRQSQGLIEPGKILGFDGSEVNLLEFHVLASNSSQVC